MPSATTPCFSRKRSGSTPRYVTFRLLAPSVTAKRLSMPSRATLPSSTRPPMRSRLPGSAGFAASSLGVTKKTMDSRSADSASAAASPSTPSAMPINTSRRPRRGIAGRRSAVARGGGGALPGVAAPAEGRHFAPNAERVVAPTLLHGGEPKEEEPLGVRQVELHCPLEGRARLLVDTAAGHRDQRFAVVGFAVGARPEQAKRFAARIRRLLVAAEACIDRRHHFPAAAVVGVLLEMRLDAPQQHAHVLQLRRLVEPGGEWRAGKIGRSERDIKNAGDHRYADQRQERRGPAAAERALRRSILARVGGSDEPPRYFDARSFRFSPSDKATGPVALDFRKLVAIHGDIGTPSEPLTAAGKRPQHGKNRRTRHKGDEEPEQHTLGPSRRRRPRSKGDKAQAGKARHG